MLRLKSLFFTLFLLFLQDASLARQHEVMDSLIAVANDMPESVEKIRVWELLVMECIYYDMDMADSLVQEIYAASERLGDELGTSIGLHHEGVLKFIRDEDYYGAIEFFEQALEIRERHQETTMVQQAMSNMGNAYLMAEDYDAALEHYFKSLEIVESLPDTINKDRARLTFALNFGLIYMRQDNFVEAKSAYRNAVHYAKLIDSPRAEAKALNYLGLCLKYVDSLDAAIAVFYEAEAISEEIGDDRNLTELYNNLGETFVKRGEYDQGLVYHLKSLAMDSALDSRGGIAISLKCVAAVHNLKGNYREGLKTAELSLLAMQKTDHPLLRWESHQVIADAYKGLGNYQKAYENQLLAMQLHDSMMSSRNTKLLDEAQAKYVQQRQKNEVIKLKKQQAEERAEQMLKDEQEASKWQLVYWGAGLGAVILILISVSLGAQRRNNRRLKEQQEVIQSKNDDLESANHEITRQRDEIEEKSKDILDSIHYAKRIQDVILPSDELMAQMLPQSFVFYQPKDIVSGDFYWLMDREDEVLVAAVDCTGHGVPGAMVSVVGHNGLNRAVKEFGLREPAEILEKLHELVEETFTAKASTGVRDGMDMALMAISKKTHEGKCTVKFAGANNPVYVVKQAGAKGLKLNDEQLLPHETDANGVLYAIKTDPQPVGPFHAHQPFTQKEIEVEQGDLLYLFSDGFADQFGGEKGKKFKYKNFRRLLLDGAFKPVDQQKEQLQTFFNEWKGSLEQLDDVCVIGIRV